jgi:hypothetical protein
MEQRTKLLITNAVIAACIGGLLALSGCGRREDGSPVPPEMTRDAAPAERIRTSGSAPDLYSICWKNLVFMTMGQQAGMVQVHNADGKPMECGK